MTTRMGLLKSIGNFFVRLFGGDKQQSNHPQSQRNEENCDNDIEEGSRSRSLGSSRTDDIIILVKNTPPVKRINSLTQKNPLQYQKFKIDKSGEQTKEEKNILLINREPVKTDLTYGDYLEYKKEVLGCSDILNYLHRISFDKKEKKIIMGIEQDKRSMVMHILQPFTKQSFFEKWITFHEIKAVEFAGDVEDYTTTNSARVDGQSGSGSVLTVFHGKKLEKIERGKEITVIDSSAVKSIPSQNITDKENGKEYVIKGTGTLGGIMRDKQEGLLYGITTQHTFNINQESEKQYHTICEMPVNLDATNQTWEICQLSDSQIGYYGKYEDAFVDVAIIPISHNIEKHPKFQKYFQNTNNNQVVKIYKQQASIQEPSLVHRPVDHIGATSGPRHGWIIQEDCEFILNKTSVGKGFIVAGETEQFAFRGDSGSIVTGCTSSGLEVIGIITAIEQSDPFNRVWCVHLDSCLDVIRKNRCIDLEFLTNKQSFLTKTQHPSVKQNKLSRWKSWSNINSSGDQEGAKSVKRVQSWRLSLNMSHSDGIATDTKPYEMTKRWLSLPILNDLTLTVSSSLPLNV